MRLAITGGASGIGRAAAQQFSAEGAAHVVVADLDIDGAEDTVRAWNQRPLQPRW